MLTHAAGGNWGSDAGREKIMSICEALMSTDPVVDVDRYGRLVVVDASTETCFKHHDTTADPGGFAETLQISKADAVSILIGDYELPQRTPKETWDLEVDPLSSIHDEDTEQPEPSEPAEPPLGDKPPVEDLGCKRCQRNTWP